jgi:hypothetical protein
VSGNTIPQSEDGTVQVRLWLHSYLWNALIIFVRESTHSATPMPGVSWELKSPLKELIPIKSMAGPSQDKGKDKEQIEMDEGKSEKV